MHSVTDRRTDGRTDGQQAYANSRSYCVAVRSANDKKFFTPIFCGGCRGLSHLNMIGIRCLDPMKWKKIGLEGNFLGGGAADPKKFVGRQNAIFWSYVAKNENWKKSFFGGGAPTPPQPTSQNWNRPLKVVWKFQAATTILTRYISPQSCSPLYKSACWTWNGQTLAF